MKEAEKALADLPGSATDAVRTEAGRRVRVAGKAVTDYTGVRQLSSRVWGN